MIVPENAPVVNIIELTGQFQRRFPRSEPVWHVRAPGRVNLIGEHTDYNDGLVLPVATSQALHVVAGPADDGRIVAESLGFEGRVDFSCDDPGGPGEPAWGNYVRGVAAMLRRDGVALRPGRLLIASEVPPGGGVSSSAALEVGAGLSLLALADRTMDPVRLALLARQAEHEYAGSPCGIMDQFICLLGQPDRALLLDCRSRAYAHIPFALDEQVLLVMNTQVKHNLGASEYPVRQRQCREGVAAIRARYPEVAALRDVRTGMLEACAGDMNFVAMRRCRHVISEIDRTRHAAEVLREGDFETFGALMFASHESLRNDYEVSCRELDALVEIAGTTPGVYGARMTGGGFGGCAIALVRRDAEASLREAIQTRYDSSFDRPAIVYATRASGGAAVEPLPPAAG